MANELAWGAALQSLGASIGNYAEQQRKDKQDADLAAAIIAKEDRAREDAKQQAINNAILGVTSKRLESDGPIMMKAQPAYVNPGLPADMSNILPPTGKLGLDYSQAIFNPATSERLATPMEQQAEYIRPILSNEPVNPNIYQMPATDLARERFEWSKLNPQTSSIKPPAGFRFTNEGNLETIPGGPADIKIRSEKDKYQQSIKTQELRDAELNATVDGALSKVGIGTAGFGARTLSSIGGTKAANLETDINTLKANLGFDRLTQMRNESKTGGALGNVSDRELALLTSAVASLDQKQSPKQLKENLMKVRTHYKRFSDALRKAGPKDVPYNELVFDQSKIAEMEAAIARGE